MNVCALVSTFSLLSLTTLHKHAHMQNIFFLTPIWIVKIRCAFAASLQVMFQYKTVVKQEKLNDTSIQVICRFVGFAEWFLVFDGAFPQTRKIE